MHVRKPLENLREGNTCLEPRDVHPEADVRPLGEGRVQPRLRPAEVESMRVGEGLRIAVRGRERNAYELSRTDPDAVEVEFPRRVAVEHGRRRLEPKRLLDRGRRQLGPCSQVRDRVLARKHMVQEVRDHPVGRLDPAEEEHRGVRDDLRRREATCAAHRTGEKRRFGLPLEHGRERRAQLGEGGLARTRRPAPGADVGHLGHDCAVPLERSVGRKVVETKRDGHGRDREWPRERDAQIRLAERRDPVEQPLAQLLDHVREAIPDGREAEGAGERAPVPSVLRAVEREHARADDLSRREARVVDRVGIGVAHHLEHQVAARHEPAVEHGQPGDRLALAQPVEQRMRARPFEVGDRRRRADRERRGSFVHAGSLAAGPYTPGVATTVSDRKLLLDGEWVETGEWLEVASPYDGSTVARVPKAGADEARAAIDAAERAMREPLPAHKRAEILVRVAGALGRRADEAARLISAEAGKPLKAARAEVARAMSTYTMAAVEVRKLAGDMVPMDASQAGEGKLAFTQRLPIGVIGAISPFNFPLNLVAHKIAPALAAGCAIVLKPASQTPLSALLLAELETDAGLPRGWLNVIVGPASEIGDVLLEDERVKLLTFTGSPDVGWGLRERAPRKKVSLELGNATPVIVEADADVEDAATRCAANAFSFAGQSCISVQRIYVHEDVYERFRDAFVPKVEALVTGDPADEETDVGPLINRDDRDRVLAWIEEARHGGAAILTGGRLEGELLLPTVVERPALDAKLSCDEAFGPVCTLQPYATLDEAIERANATRYGLQAGIFTTSLRAAFEAGRRLEFGGVIVNEAPTFRADQMPYGGVKDSGNTREGPAWAVREMTVERLVVIQL